MLLHVPEVLAPPELAQCRELLSGSTWEDGLVTAGGQAARVKRNRQLPEQAPAIGPLREIVTGALLRNPLFFAAALPNRILPPFFNRYEGGEHYGNHVDNAIRRSSTEDRNYRADVSCTLFLTDPGDYDGGELIIEDAYGVHEVKLSAGDAIVYPSTSVHRVEPVDRGARVSAFLWIQSMVREDWKRQMLFELDINIQKLRATLGETDETVGLTSHYHNLLRMWAEC